MPIVHIFVVYVNNELLCHPATHVSFDGLGVCQGNPSVSVEVYCIVSRLYKELHLCWYFLELPRSSNTSDIYSHIYKSLFQGKTSDPDMPSVPQQLFAVGNV